jgi:hypothetical protein
MRMSGARPRKGTNTHAPAWTNPPSSGHSRFLETCDWDKDCRRKCLLHPVRDERGFESPLWGAGNPRNACATRGHPMHEKSVRRVDWTSVQGNPGEVEVSSRMSERSARG